jgi:hypothetical protein
MTLEADDRIAALYETIAWEAPQGKAVECDEKKSRLRPTLGSRDHI